MDIKRKGITFQFQMESNPPKTEIEIKKDLEEIMMSIETTKDIPDSELKAFLLNR